MMKDVRKILLNPDQAQEMREDLANWKRQVDRAINSYDPNLRRINVQETQERIRRVEKQLQEEVADGQLTGAERDKLAKREKELRERITAGMVDEETMRKCPSDAPNRHLAWERANMQAILEWKNVSQQLDPENNEAQNLERFRPRGAQGYGYRSDAVIPGKMTMSDLPAQNYEQAFKPDKRKSLTPEQRKAIGERLKAGRDKRAAQAAEAAATAQG